MADQIDPKDEKVETPAVEDKPKETPKEESKDETPTTETPAKEEEKEEVFDVEEFKKQTVEEAQKAVMDKLAVGLGLTKEEKEEAKDELTPPWEKRGESKPKSWKEHAEYSADLAQWKRKKEDEQIAKVSEEQEAEAKEVNKKWNDYWDSELKGLEESNAIPEVKNPDDPNDPGKKLRIKLFAKLKEVGEDRRSKGLAPITSVELIYHKYKDELTDEAPGADAPVSFGKKGVGTDSKDDYSYDDIRKKSFDQLKGR